MLPISVRRISKELLQMKNEPIEGVSLVQLNTDDFNNYIVNIRIQQGPYKGAIAHCLLKLNDKHPQIAPFMNIFFGGGFEECGHHHIFSRGDSVGFCIDILSDSVMGTTSIGSGWNPAYTIKTLLMQIQQFISDPDKGTTELPQETILKFQKQNYQYEREFQVNQETVKHSFSQPFPPFVNDSLSLNNNPIIEQIKQEQVQQSEEQGQKSEELGQQSEEQGQQSKEKVSMFLGLKKYVDYFKETFLNQKTIEINNQSTDEEYEYEEEKLQIQDEQEDEDKISYEYEEEEEEEESKNVNGLDSQIIFDDNFYQKEKSLKRNENRQQLISEFNDDRSELDELIQDKEFQDCKSNISMEMEENNSNDFIDNQFGELNEDFIKEHLTCYMTLANPIDDPDGVFGLPIFLEIDSLGRLQSHALTEILSYEGFSSILKEHGLKKMSYLRQPLRSKSAVVIQQSQQQHPTFKSSHGNAFNCWLPLFINKNHFEKNIAIIEQTISELSSVEGMEFKPFMVLEVIPNLINKMFVKIFDSQAGIISTVAIQAYVQMFQLLINFCERYPSLQDTLDKKVIDFVRSDFNRNKQVIGDFGEFFVILGASSFSFNQFEFLDLLYREQSARQMMWLENNEEFMIEFTSFPQPQPPYKDDMQIHITEQEQELRKIQMLAYDLESEEMYENQMKSVWRHVTIGHNLLVFTIEAAKYLTNRQFLKRLERSYSLVSDEYATHFVKYTRKVRQLINNHKDFLNYIGLGNKYDSFEKVHEVFQIGIFVSNYQGYTRKKNEIDKKIHEFKPNLKHFNLECKRLFNLRLKSQIEIEEKKLLKNLEKITLEDIRLDGLKEDMNNYCMMNFSSNKTFQREENQRCDVFKKSMLTFSKDQDDKLSQINQKLSTPMIDQFQSQFARRIEDSQIGKSVIKLEKSWQSQILKKEDESKLRQITQTAEEKKAGAQKFYQYSKEDKVAARQNQNQNQWRNPNQEPPKKKEEESITVVQTSSKKEINKQQDILLSFRQQTTNNNPIPTFFSRNRIL